MILSVGGFFGKIGGGFKKVGSGLKTGGKVAWKVYNSGPGQVLITAFAPAKVASIVAGAVGVINETTSYVGEQAKRNRARELVLSRFPQAADDKQLLNFLIEAQLQKLAGNAEIS